jgi:hypothetical protein
MFRFGIIAGLLIMTAGCKFGTYAETRSEEIVRFERSQPECRSVPGDSFLMTSAG